MIEQIVAGGILLIMLSGGAKPLEIDMDRMIHIESEGRAMAFNSRSHARGILQITPILVEEWNEFHPKNKFTLNDLHKPAISLKIGKWYLSQRIPAILRAKKLPVTRRNILVCWNAGILKLIKEKQNGLPKETHDFLRKYEAKKED